MWNGDSNWTISIYIEFRGNQSITQIESYVSDRSSNYINLSRDRHHAEKNLLFCWTSHFESKISFRQHTVCNVIVKGSNKTQMSWVLPLITFLPFYFSLNELVDCIKTFFLGVRLTSGSSRANWNPIQEIVCLEVYWSHRAVKSAPGMARNERGKQLVSQPFKNVYFKCALNQESLTVTL